MKTNRPSRSCLSRVKRASAAACLIGALAAFPGLAHADATGYPCDVTFYPGATSLGNYGYINFELYTNSGCSGSLLGSFYLATTGTTIGFIYYNADQINTMSQNLINAWQARRQVTALNISTGQSGSVNVANYLYFYK